MQKITWFDNMRFFVGLHQPSNAHRFERCCISVNRLITRKSGFVCHDWIMDSGAFTSITKWGEHMLNPRGYAEEINRWSSGRARSGTMLAAVTQDYMCEEFALAKTGKTVQEHQAMTIDRYDQILSHGPTAYLMPVLQGFSPESYASHVRDYGSRLRPSQWVGVGSVCRRNGDPKQIEDVLLAIHEVRQDIRLHGFGIKLTALRSPLVSKLLWSADSMAWSFAARRAGRNANSPEEAAAYCRAVDSIETQNLLFI